MNKRRLKHKCLDEVTYNIKGYCNLVGNQFVDPSRPQKEFFLLRNKLNSVESVIDYTKSEVVNQSVSQIMQLSIQYEPGIGPK